MGSIPKCIPPARRWFLLIAARLVQSGRQKEVQVSIRGDGALTVTLIQISLAPGLSFDLNTMTVSGTSTEGRYNYILLRVQHRL